jgi:tripartite ATP-independent transporter DctM subunit
MNTVVALAFAVLLLVGAPIGMVLGLTAAAGLLYSSPDLLVVLPQKFLAGIDSIPLLAAPLFILAGTLMGQGGIARRIVHLAMVFVGRLPGGLAMVTVVATMFFSGISGSSSADTAAIGSLTLPGMKERKYPTPFATAIVATAGATGTLIPPSIDLLIIGIIANISIAGLFAAGFLPAIVNGLGVLALVYYHARKLDLPLEPRLSMREKINALVEGIPALLMAIILLGGILGGVFTPTEASAVAVIYGLCITMFFYRELKLSDLPRLLLQTCEITGMVFLVVGMASVLGFVLTYQRIPQMIGQFIAQSSGNWVVFLLYVNVLFLILGCLMDALPALIVLMPILVPVAVSFGLDPIHFGILVEANVGISLISPPVGIVLYVACGLSRLPIEAVVKPLMPFLLILVVTLLVISYVPAITLFVPRMLGYAAG